MKTIAYFTGRPETDKEAHILEQYGTSDIDPAYGFTTWELEIRTLEDLVTLASKLELLTFRVWLPNQEHKQPLIEFSVDKDDFFY